MRYRFPACLLCCLLAVAGGGRLAALEATPFISPTPMPGVDGDPTRPMWLGKTWNDSVYSTGATALHAIGITGRGVSAAVFDTPFDTTHERLRNNIVAACGITIYDPSNDLYSYLTNPAAGITGTNPLDVGYVRDDDDPTLFWKEGLDAVHLRVDGVVDPKNTNLHGTHVAGTILGMAPDAGLALLAGVAIIPSATVPGAWEARALHGYEDMMVWAADNAARYNIAAYNGSYGRGFFADSASADLAEPDVAEALAMMRDNGIIPFLASHNDGANNYVSSPAANTGAVAVGALHPSGLITAFSNQSANVVLVAPGQDIYSSIPGWSVGGTTGEYGYDAWPGTSMATPHVTGGLVLLKSGARNASTEEILQSLILTGDPVYYDGSVVVPPGYFANSPREMTLDEIRAAIVGQNPDLTPDEAAELSRRLEQTEYRFIRVDKAYRHLTSTRTVGLMSQALSTGTPHALNLGSFAVEQGKYLDAANAALFQRLDGQDPHTLARAARQLGPAFANSTLQSATFGLADLHGLVGKRMMTHYQWLARDLAPSAAGNARPAAADGALMHLRAAPGGGVAVWAEGFGGYQNRSETLAGSDYDGHFAGAALGVERGRGDAVFGGFVAWSNHNIKADRDGKTRGDWGSLGVYAGAARDSLAFGASVSAGIGDYDLRRGVYGPGIAFPGMVYDPVTFTAASDSRSYAATGRASASHSFDFGRWRLGPAAEGFVSYAHMESYRERNAGGLTLAVDGHDYFYGEGGAGLQASALFCAKSRPLLASMKLLGLYGRSDAGTMTGMFATGGTPFRAGVERVSTGWFVPEASLAWRVSERVTLNASYQGRFGKKTNINAGSLSVSLTW